MSILNIQFHDKITTFPQIFVLLIYRKNFVGTEKRVRISHDKRAIGFELSRFDCKLIEYSLIRVFALRILLTS